MTDNEADKAQEWKGIDGATAWHLIDRYAEDWSEVGAMMNAWLRANVNAEREACAITAWNVGMDQHNKSLGLPCDAREVGSYAANAIRARGNK